MAIGGSAPPPKDKMHARSIGSALVGLTLVVSTGAFGAGCGRESSEAPPVEVADGSALDSGTPGVASDSGGANDSGSPGSGDDGSAYAPPHAPSQQLDLLFTIDNSASM